MRYPASEKAEIIRLVEACTSRRGAHWTSSASRAPRFIVGMIAIAPAVFEALADHRSRPDRVWNRSPRRSAEIIEPALRETELSPRELAVRFTGPEELLARKLGIGC